jgi:AraC-like DNA-binding protein
MKANTETPRGLLDRRHSESKFKLARYDPIDAHVAAFVSHYWVVTWDLTGQPPYESESLPYPNVHLAFQRGMSGIFGPPRGKFVRRLEGRDRVFGISFRPGGFHPVAQAPVHRFSNRRTPVRDVFGEDGLAVEEAILHTERAEEQIALSEAFLRSRNLRFDPAIAFTSRVVDKIAADRMLLRVEDVAHAEGVSRRKLERIFRHYVGVSPKWVVQRYRLFEAADRLATESVVDAADLAQQLGYCDQAHFIKDFKTMVGCSPADYARRATAP